MIQKILREEGVRGFYKGLSASYLGVAEGTIQWTLYERLKKLNAGPNGKGNGGLQEWMGMLGSAGTAKCVASLITYPHEVCELFYSIPLCFFAHPCPGHPYSPTSTDCQRCPEIYRSLPNPTTRYCRGGRAITIWRAQRSSHASSP